MKGLITDIDIIDKPQAEPAIPPSGKKLYIESYGCQMNFADSEVVASILQKEGFQTTHTPEDADIVFLNTCSIRDKAEQTVRNRLGFINSLKKNKPDLVVGLLGCMAERLKTKLLEEERIVDLVAGPDAYRDLPNLISQIDDGGKAINTFLSREETYADINPVRLNSNGVTAFVSIMRGCDNMCSFCVVPFTRGRERSRDPHSIVREAEALYESGYREITLLGQNVDSYKWSHAENNKARLERTGSSDVLTFAGLLDLVARVSPDLRIRFSTSHPKDITDEVLHTMARHDNICKHIHLPVQSGNNRILELMNRGYTREWYLSRVNRIREIFGPDFALSSDIITGFCSETEEEHRDTLSLMEEVGFDYSYMFAYSERPGTPAAKKIRDDIPEEVKKRRLSEIIQLQGTLSAERNRMAVGKTHKVLVEGYSKRSEEFMQGRNTENKVVVFPGKKPLKGTYVHIHVNDCTGATLLGQLKSN